MDSQRAIALLRERIDEGQQVIYGNANFTEWKSKSRLILGRIYGEDGSLVQQFDKVRYTLSMSSTSTPQNEHRKARDRGVRRAMALLESAIFEREQLTDPRNGGTESIDPELWSHVSRLAEDGQWAQLASVTATFFEDKIRGWAGSPRTSTVRTSWSRRSKPKVVRSLVAELPANARAGNSSRPVSCKR